MQFRLRLSHLYPNLMNLYGDRGNILTLRRRCSRRDIDLVVDEIGLGDEFQPEQYDLALSAAARTASRAASRTT